MDSNFTLQFLSITPNINTADVYFKITFIPNGLTKYNFKIVISKYSIYLKDSKSLYVQNLVPKLTSFQFLPNQLIQLKVEKTGEIHIKLKINKISQTTSFNKDLLDPIPNRYSDHEPQISGLFCKNCQHNIASDDR